MSGLIDCEVIPDNWVLLLPEPELEFESTDCPTKFNENLMVPFLQRIGLWNSNLESFSSTDHANIIHTQQTHLGVVRIRSSRTAVQFDEPHTDTKSDAYVKNGETVNGDMVFIWPDPKGYDDLGQEKIGTNFFFGPLKGFPDAVTPRGCVSGHSPWTMHNSPLSIGAQRIVAKVEYRFDEGSDLYNNFQISKAGLLSPIKQKVLAAVRGTELGYIHHRGSYIKNAYPLVSVRAPNRGLSL